MTGMLRRVGKLYCALDGRRAAKLAALLGKVVVAPGDDIIPKPVYPAAQAAAEAVVVACRRLVFRALFAPTKAALSGVGKLQAWGSDGGSGGGGAAAVGLEFSVAPSEYVHTVAQSLLDVPTQVRPQAIPSII